MRSRALRLYVVLVTLVLFVALAAVIAAKPWAARSGSNAALDKLVAREWQLRREARVVEQVVHRRWAGYRRRLREREAQIRELEQRHAAELSAAPTVAASGVVTLAPQVRVVTLPPAGASTSSGSSHP